MIRISIICRWLSTSGNKKFLRNAGKIKQELNLHQSIGKIKENQMFEHINRQSKQELASKMVQGTSYDKELKEFVQKFNKEHKDEATLLDFSHYTTNFGDLKNKPLEKSDINLIKEFQKRKEEIRLSNLKEKFFQRETHEQQDNKIDDEEIQNTSQYETFFDKKKTSAESAHEKTKLFDGNIYQKDNVISQGNFIINDNFVILLLSRGTTTQITRLNRLVTHRVLLFMGNGNGLISYAKAKDKSYEVCFNKGLNQLRKNVIAIPIDHRCSLPLPINESFQDFNLYLRPNVSYNSWGYPILSMMLTLAGIDHAGFNLSHRGKNVYNAVNVLFKSLTKNTTPQQLAEMNGFKVYRHQFIRPLTFVRTHGPISK